MKTLSFFCFFLFFHLLVTAQQGAVSAGASASGTSGSVSYTIGQVDYTTATGGGVSITEGVNQPYEISIITGAENTSIQLHYSVYPNPSRDHVTLLLENVSTDALSYSLSTIQGKQLLLQKIENPSTVIPMEELANGIYFIRLFNNNEEIKSFKVIKNK